LKIKSNLVGYLFGLAFIASSAALQVPSHLVYSSDELSGSLDRSLSGLNRPAGKAVARSYGDLPLSFEANRGQTDSRVKFLSRGSGYNLFLTAKEAVIRLHAPARPLSKIEHRPSASVTEQSSIIRMKLVGANAESRIIGLDELPGKSNYFIGSDPKKWRLNVPNYSRVKYQNAYPGVDVVFYSKGGQLEYDFIVAPGASFKAARIAFEGVQGVRLDASGNLLIATSSGEIRQRNPAIYQEADGAKEPVEGGYVIRGKREIGFEVRHYDLNKTLVIDPVMVYSTTIGGSHNETASAIALDREGNAYIAGTTDSQNFPTVNPFQPNLKIGVAVGFPSDAFVAKLNSAGTALLYSTYLGGANIDGANGIAVDAEGNAYVTGYVASTDFPITPGAFQEKAVSGGSAFMTKLNPSGNALVYSTFLGGAGNNFSFSLYIASVGTSIAVGPDGSAYATGYTVSRSFPLRRALQDQLNRGVPFRCCVNCLHQAFFGLELTEDAFVTKLNPSGTRLVYSTYLGGTGQDEGHAIAVDSSGNAYVTGGTCSRDFASNELSGATDAFVAKISSSGRTLVYSRLLGGSGDDAGNSFALDASGNAYVAGQTDSMDFPATAGAFQAKAGGSASYMSLDGGVNWTAATGLPDSPVNVLAVDPTNSLTVYAGIGNCVKSGGVFKTTDGGITWRPTGITVGLIEAIAVDSTNPSTVYADRTKSTDGGDTWRGMGPFSVVRQLVIDPKNTNTVYLVEGFPKCSDAAPPPSIFRSTDGGTSWKDLNFYSADSLIIDPKSPATLYATNGNLFKSTDAGKTWRVPYQGNRSLVVLAIDPNETATLYFKDSLSNNNKLLKTTDGGMSFSVMGLTGVPIKGLVVDQTNSSILYAATGDLGYGGGVFKNTDGGQTWKATDLTGMTINTLAIDPLNSSRIYAGGHFDTDGFIAKVNAADGAIVYSTYLGTRARDVVTGIGIDGAGNSYVTGKTFSDRFPTKDALLATKPGGPFDTAPFITKLNATGSTVLFSTYLGGNEPSFGSAIAVDGAGKTYVAGTTGLPVFVPSARLAESAQGGSDAFVVKIASAPRITGASISGKSLIVAGEGFDPGAVILVGGVEQRTKNYESRPATVLIGRKTGNSIAPGQNVTIQVRNSDGLISDPFSFTR
jgi:photosystem II stability/assembly factor-like uncharacterized protein